MSKSKSKMKRWSRAWNANFLRLHTQFTYYTKTQRNRRAALLWQLTFHFDSRLLLIFCDIQINNDAHFTFRWGFECSFRPIFTQICVYIYVCKRTLAPPRHSTNASEFVHSPSITHKLCNNFHMIILRANQTNPENSHLHFRIHYKISNMRCVIYTILL